jgi:hypothetical protein
MSAIRPGFRVLVTGSRSWTDTTTITTTLGRLHAVHGQLLVIVHGACPRGADSIAAAWCHRAGVATEEHPADWVRHGRAAGIRRNTAMVATRPDLCLAFIRNHSPGASHCAQTAQQAGIPVIRHTYLWRPP